MTDILYYDGLCALCTKEMDRLRQIKADSLELRDIHELADDTPGLPSKEQLLKVLHLQRGTQFLTGIDANIAAWQHTRYGILWRWMAWPVIRWFVELAYDRWARWRYERLYDCEACSH